MDAAASDAERETILAALAKQLQEQPHGKVIPVVDGEKFELHRNVGNEAEPSSHQWMRRSFMSTTGTRAPAHNQCCQSKRASAYEDAHAAAVAVWHNRQVAAHYVEHPIVVAPPRTLGELRRRYDSALKGVLFYDLDKEMTGRSGHDILGALLSR